MSDNANRVEFTREMKKDYTIITPNMAPIHFELIKNVLESFGYHIDLLRTTGREIADEGLKYVHNDTCYPALLSIGQLMHALHSGKYDLHKVALIMTQTGGGCRASNYIHLLRKALEKAGMGYIPVISISFGLEKNPGFHLTIPLLRRLIYAMMYGDLIMNVANQVRPYEVNAGETDALVETWKNRLIDRFQQGRVAGVVVDVLQPLVHHCLPLIVQLHHIVAFQLKHLLEHPEVDGEHLGHQDGVFFLHLLGEQETTSLVIY